MDRTKRPDVEPIEMEVELEKIAQGIRLETGNAYVIKLDRLQGIFNPRWSATEARSGETVELLAEARGFADDTPVKLTIFEHDADGNHDRVAELEAKVKQNAVRATWRYEYTEDVDEEGEGKPYTKPEYFFVCEIGDEKAQSGLLEFKDFVEISCVDGDGVPQAGLPYTLYFPTGEKKQGVLDAEGRARVDGVPPGPYHVEFDWDHAVVVPPELEPEHFFPEACALR